MSHLTDNDTMPFGKYKDKKLIDVPDFHLDWLKLQISEKAPNKRNFTEKVLLKYILKREEDANEK